MSNQTLIGCRAQYAMELPHGVRLSVEPTLFVEPGATELVADLEVPLDRIIDFAADTNGVDPKELESLAIRFFPLEGKTTIKGSMGDRPEPLADPDVYHFPVINLGVWPGVSSKWLNFALRHEIRHGFQEPIGPEYVTKSRIRTVRAGALLAASALAFMGNEIVDPATKLATFATVPVIGAIATSKIASNLAYDIGWSFNRRELDANAYSLRHRSFRPIQ